MFESTMLVKYLAHSGICSRRKAVDAIKQGMVRVNNTIVLEPWYEVRPSDKVTFQQRIVRPEINKVYILLNKPAGYVTTVSDEQGRKTVMDLVASAAQERLYPVGRLDQDTTGLLLITNDGDIASKLAHPRSNIKKVYHVHLDQPLTAEALSRIRHGITLDKQRVTVDHIGFRSERGNKRNVEIELHSGKNRVVRRLFKELGYNVQKLDRVNFAGFGKKGAPEGAWRFLTRAEIERLKITAG